MFATAITKRQRTLGMRVTWNKRYITLAPVATVALGLAFHLHDPDHLLGDKEDIGITLALIPVNTPGVKIGRRHFPAGQAFQNGPTQGNDVFIPMDWIIGGQAQVGHGWRMLMDCSPLGGPRAFRCRRFPPARRNSGRPDDRRLCPRAPAIRPVGPGASKASKSALARIAGNGLLRWTPRGALTAATLDVGEQPSVISAILKYHATERMRTAMNDALDIHGGRGIIEGPGAITYKFGAYQSVPVAITVEGANILTRSLMIFGQGAIRCHPHLLKEIAAAHLTDPQTNPSKRSTRNCSRILAISHPTRCAPSGTTSPSAASRMRLRRRASAGCITICIPRARHLRLRGRSWLWERSAAI